MIGRIHRAGLQQCLGAHHRLPALLVGRDYPQVVELAVAPTVLVKAAARMRRAAHINHLCVPDQLIHVIHTPVIPRPSPAFKPAGGAWHDLTDSGGDYGIYAGVAPFA